jgi:hypothetical protein
MPDMRIEQADRRYELAAFGGDPSELDLADRDLDAAEADLALARGKIRHARFLAHQIEDARELEDFERARQLYHSVGDLDGEALAAFWTGCFHQVVRQDGPAALPALTFARDNGQPLTRSYATRHLGFHALHGGDVPRAGALLEESLRLRRAHGSPAEIAAALLALAGQRARAGNPGEAHSLLTEATNSAHAAGAAGVLRWISVTREELTAQLPANP